MSQVEHEPALTINFIKKESFKPTQKSRAGVLSETENGSVPQEKSQNRKIYRPLYLLEILETKSNYRLWEHSVVLREYGSMSALRYDVPDQSRLVDEEMVFIFYSGIYRDSLRKAIPREICLFLVPFNSLVAGN